MGGHTSDGAMNNGPVFELDSYCLVVQFHQKSNEREEIGNQHTNKMESGHWHERSVQQFALVRLPLRRQAIPEGQKRLAYLTSFMLGSYEPE